VAQKPDLDDEAQAALATLARHLARKDGPPRDWVDEFTVGEIVTTHDAATIGDTSAETARRHCVEAEAAGTPIGIYVAGTWLISTRRFLAWIERRDGSHARLSAESRAQKMTQARAAPRKLVRG
jgi:hypothetical protein